MARSRQKSQTIRLPQEVHEFMEKYYEKVKNKKKFKSKNDFWISPFIQFYNDFVNENFDK